MNPQRKQPHILIVDDGEINIYVLEKILSEHNYDIATMRDGQSALEYAKKYFPDLILLDIIMPLVDGYEVCKRLKANETTKNIPIIFLSAMTDVDSLEKGFDVGGQDYLIKPFKPKELISRVKTHLDLKEKTQNLENLNRTLEEKIQERTLQLQQANDSLLLANKKISRLDKAKNDFLFLINHELRTPLNGILGFASMLENASHETKRASFVKMINKSAQRLLKISEIALLITSLRADNYKTLIQPAKLYAILLEVTTSLKNQIEANNVKVEINNEFEKLEVKTDRKLIFNCLQIVLGNAVKFTAPNSTVTISVEIDGDFAKITITDQGIGFDQDVLNASFDYFTTANISHHSKGLGLGLSTAKLIMDTLSGEINLFNKENNTGAVAELKIPINI